MKAADVRNMRRGGVRLPWIATLESGSWSKTLSPSHGCASMLAQPGMNLPCTMLSRERCLTSFSFQAIPIVVVQLRYPHKASRAPHSDLCALLSASRPFVSRPLHFTGGS